LYLFLFITILVKPHGIPSCAGISYGLYFIEFFN
jgi:hypothetical protein